MTWNLSIAFEGMGLLALTGSGEYLPGMEPVDRRLIAHLNEPARVVCLPTAAGTEGEQRIRYWMNLGEEHFSALGVQSVKSLYLINREGAQDESLTEQIRTANFVYISGGKPWYLEGVLRDTPAWAAILDVLSRGGVVAGCSAGAMIMGGRIPGASKSLATRAGFGLLPGTFVMPHFDELPGWISSNLSRIVSKHLMLGVDGYTALACTRDGFRVVGKGSVTLAAGRLHQRFTEGDGLLPVESSNPNLR